MVDPQSQLDSEKKPDWLARMVAAKGMLLCIALLCAALILYRPETWIFAAVLMGIVLLGVFLTEWPDSGVVDGFYAATKDEIPVGDVYTAVLNAIGYPAYIIDQSGNIRFVNQAGDSVFGPVEVGSRISRKFRDPHLVSTIEEALSSTSRYQTEYKTNIRGDRWFGVEISPIPQSMSYENLEPRSGLFLLGFQDRTEAKRTDQMRSDFIANASHELRTPLASVLGYLETIKGAAKKDPAAQKKFVNVMLEQAERMSRLINDLLSLSQIEMKTHMKPSGKVNLCEVLSYVTALHGSLANSLNVSLNLELNDHREVFVIGDRDELIQVFQNLVENACKYGEKGERVIVSLEMMPSGNDALGEVKAIVTDFGSGIASEDLQRITERFYRVDVVESREKQGTGLGLAIVKHILKRHNTRLIVESELGKGSRFSVKFSIAA